MKEYTAIYSTESLKGIQYSFDANNTEEAVKFCMNKISSFPNLVIVENVDRKPANYGKVVWSYGCNVL